jgi:PAT family beta-lactamase induction signal transducer AmpG
MNLYLAERRYLRLAVMCALYVAQGIPYGFATITLTAYFAEKGASTDAIGTFSALIGFPWMIKFVWGPFLDRFSRSTMGKRRPWILGAQAMMILTAAFLIAVPGLNDDLRTLGWIWLVHNIFVSLQDVSVDALAVDLLPERERGLANGMMYGSAYLGIAIGGAGLSTVVGQHDLQTAMVYLVLSLAAIMMLPLFLRERAGDSFLSPRLRPRDPSEPPRSTRRVFADLGRAFVRRSPLLGVVWAICIYIGPMALSTIGTVLLIQKLGWSQEEYGQMAGGFPLFFGLGGSVAGGWIADRLGHRRVLAAASILCGITWITFAAMQSYWTDRTFIVVFTCAEGAFVGILSASFFALAMDLSWPRVAATQFTAYMTFGNVSRTIGSKLSGTISDMWDVAGAYLAFGIFQIAIVVILIPIDPHQNRRELGTD